MWSRQYLLVFLCFVLVAVCGGRDVPDFISIYKTDQKIEEIFKVAAEKNNVPGAVFGMHTPDGHTMTFSYGLANLENHEPMTVRHLFRVGSITKTFTAASILLLVDQGKLTLGQTLESLSPEVFPNGENITVRMLLQMRSGLADYPETDHFVDTIDTDPLHFWTISELLEMTQVEYEADDKFAYRNINYQILGYIIEIVSGEKFGDFVTDNILNPLKLDDTQIPVGAEMPKHSANGYLVINDTPTNVGEVTDPSWAGAAGNMISSVDDLLVWQEAIQHGTIMSAKSRKEMFTLRPGILGKWSVGYGLGWMKIQGAEGHGGNYSDIYTGAMFSVMDVGFVILVNGRQVEDSGDATELVFDITSKLLPLKKQ